MAVYTKKIKDTKKLTQIVNKDGKEYTKGYLEVTEPVRNRLLLFAAPFSIFIRNSLPEDQLKRLNDTASMFNDQLNNWFYAFESQDKPLYVPDLDKFSSLYQRAVNDTTGAYRPEDLKKDFEDTIRDCIAKNFETARECRFVQAKAVNPITLGTGKRL